MPGLNIAPTKSNLLSLKRQLAFAEEGYDLLEQKRQILILELMKRLARARRIESQVETLLQRARHGLREAVLDNGLETLERAALGVTSAGELTIRIQHLMGMKLPNIIANFSRSPAPFGVSDTSASADVALQRFVELPPALVELAELQTAVHRLARELRKTQRRCNALSKIFMPAYRQTIATISDTLEERERESLVILKMIRNRLPQNRKS